MSTTFEAAIVFLLALALGMVAAELGYTGVRALAMLTACSAVGVTAGNFLADITLRR